MIETQKYIRKPLYVDAVRVTSANIQEIAEWCQGEILMEEGRSKGSSMYIKVRVHNPKNPRQTKAFVGDWLLYTERGYKVYTNKAFHASFDLTASEPEGAVLAPIDVESAGPVVAHPDPETGVEPILGVGEPQTLMTPQGEPIEVVPATAQNIATAVKENEEARFSKVVDAAEGKRVLSLEEQQQMSQDEIRTLIQSGEAVLVQDLAA